LEKIEKEKRKRRKKRKVKKKTLCQVVFTIRQLPSKTSEEKIIIKVFGVRWRQMAYTQQKNKQNLAEVSFLLLVKGKHIETSATNGHSNTKDIL